MYVPMELAGWESSSVSMGGYILKLVNFTFTGQESAVLKLFWCPQASGHAPNSEMTHGERRGIERDAGHTLKVAQNS